MSIIQWVVFVFCCVVSLYILVFNYFCIYANYRNKKAGVDKHVSYIPFVAAVFALIATAVSPLEVIKSGVGLFGVVFIVDVGTSGILVLLILSGVKYLYGRVNT